MLYPHISSLFYLEHSALDAAFQLLQIPKKYPLLTSLFHSLRSEPEFGLDNTSSPFTVTPTTDIHEVPTHPRGAMVPEKFFHLWLEALLQVKVGTKPPLRYPFVYKTLDGNTLMAKM